MARLFLFLFCVACNICIGQTHVSNKDSLKEIKNFSKYTKHPIQHHDLRIGLVVAHTYIPTNTIRGEETFIVPTIGLDIEYWANHKWGIGLHNDLEIEVFEVETNKGLFIEKKFPVLFTLDILYKPFKNFVVLLGPGYEIEPAENLWVFRTGIEYEIEINEIWDFAPAIIYDYRHQAFDTWAYGIGVGVRF